MHDTGNVETALGDTMITGYTLKVHRGARAGLVRHYPASSGRAARRFADRLDLEYGAICASVQPTWAQPTTQEI